MKIKIGVLVVFALVLSGCSVHGEFGYHGRTGVRNTTYSPTIDDGDEQYVSKVSKRY